MKRRKGSLRGLDRSTPARERHAKEIAARADRLTAEQVRALEMVAEHGSQILLFGGTASPNYSKLRASGFIDHIGTTFEGNRALEYLHWRRNEQAQEIPIIQGRSKEHVR